MVSIKYPGGLRLSAKPAQQIFLEADTFRNLVSAAVIRPQGTRQSLFNSTKTFEGKDSCCKISIAKARLFATLFLGLDFVNEWRSVALKLFKA